MPCRTGELFAVERPRTADGERAALHAADYDALRRETSVFTDAFASCPTSTPASTAA